MALFGDYLTMREIFLFAPIVLAVDLWSYGVLISLSQQPALNFTWDISLSKTVVVFYFFPKSVRPGSNLKLNFDANFNTNEC